MKLRITAIISLLLGACSTDAFLSSSKRLYEVRMMNGESLYTQNRPQVQQDGYYRFNDVNGQQYILNESIVLFVGPTEVAR